jgi:hypothetical protein
MYFCVRSLSIRITPLQHFLLCFFQVLRPLKAHFLQNVNFLALCARSCWPLSPSLSFVPNIVSTTSRIDPFFLHCLLADVLLTSPRWYSSLHPSLPYSPYRRLYAPTFYKSPNLTSTNSPKRENLFSPITSMSSSYNNLPDFEGNVPELSALPPAANPQRPPTSFLQQQQPRLPDAPSDIVSPGSRSPGSPTNERGSFKRDLSPRTNPTSNFPPNSRQPQASSGQLRPNASRLPAHNQPY